MKQEPVANYVPRGPFPEPRRLYTLAFKNDQWWFGGLGRVDGSDYRRVFPVVGTLGTDYLLALLSYPSLLFGTLWRDTCVNKRTCEIVYVVDGRKRSRVVRQTAGQNRQISPKLLTYLRAAQASPSSTCRATTIKLPRARFRSMAAAAGVRSAVQHIHVELDVTRTGEKFSLQQSDTRGKWHVSCAAAHCCIGRQGVPTYSCIALVYMH